MREEDERDIDIDSMYRIAFNTIEGKEVLKDLCDVHFIHLTTCANVDSRDEMVFREGQRAVVLRIQGILENKFKDDKEI